MSITQGGWGGPHGDYWGTQGVSFERTTRPFVDKPNLLPPPSRVPLITSEVEPEEDGPEPGQLWWGGEGVPSPIEDMNADGYLIDFQEGTEFVPSTAPDAPEDPPEEPPPPPDPDVPTPDKTEKVPKKKKPQDDVPGILTGDEMDRQTVTFKVYNPDNSEQWVKVQAVKSIRFRLHEDQSQQNQPNEGGRKPNTLNGRILKLNLKPPPPPPKPPGAT